MSLIESFAVEPEALTLDWSNGHQSRLIALWLRDHCQGAECRDPHSGQRLFDVADLPENVTIARAEFAPGGALEITFAPDGHRAVFSQGWLRAHCYCLTEPDDDRVASRKQLWKAGTFPDGTLPWTSYAVYLRDPEARRRTLASVRDYGFALLSGVPTRKGAVLDVIRSFGYVRETNYGELFDVRTVIDPNNLAFSNLGLGCHTDNPYRDPVPTLQLLHCLENTASGGESVLVDGFQAADELKCEAIGDFALLATHPVEFRFDDTRSALRARVCMLEVDAQGELIGVRYNNRSIDTLRLPPDRMAAFYRAYRRFSRTLSRPDLKVTFKMGPGDLVILENTRVLHARTAIESGGRRHLQGAYADRDGLYSALRLLEGRSESVRAVA